MAKTLFVPPLGTELTLASDWTFDLYGEHRNNGLWRALKIARPADARGFYYDHLSKPVTLPAGSQLTVRRYYIRQGRGAFDSVTFSVKVGKKSTRFWVKLADANRIELENEAATPKTANVFNAIADYLRRYDGMSAVDSDLVQKMVRDAQRLGHFDLKAANG